MAADRPRYLDRRAGRAYTDDPTFKLPGEPEPVDEDFQRLISAGARARFEHEHAHELARRENKSRSARLRTVQSEALALGVDGRSELRSIDTAIDLLSRKNARARSLASPPRRPRTRPRARAVGPRRHRTPGGSPTSFSRP